MRPEVAAALEVVEEVFDSATLLVERREGGLPPLPFDGRVESSIDGGMSSVTATSPASRESGQRAGGSSST